MKAFVLIVALLMPTMALAQLPRLRPPLTGNIIDDLKAKHQEIETKEDSEIANFLNALVDIPGAITLSNQIQSLQDPVGLACWNQFAGISELIRLHPLPFNMKIASDWEALRLLHIGLNQVCANPNCGQMFVDLTNAISALMPIRLPVSLQSICSKVPVIGTSAVPTASIKQGGFGTIPGLLTPANQ